MKVFISWSGERSRLVGELLDDWLQCVLQAIDPWMSSKDIDRGSLWFSEITDQLKDTSVGIILLTQANKEKPWILFEAGALAKGLSSNKVCTFLIDLQPTDITDPLAQFNHTFPNRDGLWQLVRTLNSSLLDKGLKEKVLDRVFDTYWPQFEIAFKDILTTTPDTPKAETKRKNDDVLLELLSSTRNIDRRLRNLESGQVERDFRYINKDRDSLAPIPPVEAELIVRSLFESNTPTETIFGALKGVVPLAFVRKSLNNLRHQKETRPEEIAATTED